MTDPLYIKSVQLKEPFRCFKKDDMFNFENITLLVGDQGSGKSSLLELLQRNDKILNVELTELATRGVQTFYFDAEKMNPRTKDPMLYTNCDGTNKGIGLGTAIASRWTSHGETLAGFTVNALHKAENCIVFLDEPESALSIRNQYKLVEEVVKASNRNCQLIISTHCLPLIQSVKDVLSLEDRKWMPSETFIHLQYAN